MSADFAAPLFDASWDNYYDAMYKRELEDPSMRGFFEYFDVDIASELVRLNKPA